MLEGEGGVPAGKGLLCLKRVVATLISPSPKRNKEATLLTLPAAMCLSQRLSHAVASASFSTPRLGMVRKLSCSLRSCVPTWIAVVILKRIRVQCPELQVGKCGLAKELVEAIPARMASHNYLDVLCGIGR